MLQQTSKTKGFGEKSIQFRLNIYAAMNFLPQDVQDSLIVLDNVNNSEEFISVQSHWIYRQFLLFRGTKTGNFYLKFRQLTTVLICFV